MILLVERHSRERRALGFIRCSLRYEFHLERPARMLWCRRFLPCVFFGSCWILFGVRGEPSAWQTKGALKYSSTTAPANLATYSAMSTLFSIFTPSRFIRARARFYSKPLNWQSLGVFATRIPRWQWTWASLDILGTAPIVEEAIRAKIRLWNFFLLIAIAMLSLPGEILSTGKCRCFRLPPRRRRFRRVYTQPICPVPTTSGTGLLGVGTQQLLLGTGHVGRAPAVGGLWTPALGLGQWRVSLARRVYGGRT